MFQSGLRPGTAVGDERHVLQALLSGINIKTLLVGPWICAVSALVQNLLLERAVNLRAPDLVQLSVKPKIVRQIA